MVGICQQSKLNASHPIIFTKILTFSRIYIVKLAFVQHGLHF
jgi:hypothetical protein